MLAGARDTARGGPIRAPITAVARSCQVMNLPADWSERFPRPMTIAVMGRFPTEYRPRRMGVVMRFQLLGPVEVWQDENPVALRGSKMRTVLGTLLLSHNRLVSDSILVEMLWGEAPPATAQAQIQTYASRLRGLLGPHVTIERRWPGYLLRVPQQSVDVVTFEHRAALGRSALAEGRPREAQRALASALALWRGRALTDVTEFLAAAEQPRLEESRLAVLEDRIDADLALGRHDDLALELMTLVADQPMRERLRARLMLALYRCGRKADALAVYEEGRAVLAEELGIDPTATLRDLHQAILLDKPSLTPRSIEGTAPQRASVASWSAHLTAEPADFTGREKALGQAQTWLDRPGRDSDRPGICVVVGMGGVGKSAFALNVARRLRDSYPHGQFRIDLEGSTGAPLAPMRALADLVSALGADVSAAGNSVTELTRLYRNRVHGRRLLLLFENAASERQVRPLLPATPGCDTVVTSRDRLTALEDAHRIELDAFEPAEATELLVKIIGSDRAAAEPHALTRIAELCGYLPLGIRISGARLTARPHWPLRTLAERLADRYRVLDELEAADLGVRESMSRSYRPLREGAKRALRLLSLVDGSCFSLWTASVAVDLTLSDTEDVVEELVEAYMLRVCDSCPSRYWFGPFVHAFAQERVRSEETARERGAVLDRLAGLPRAWLGAGPRANGRGEKI